MKIFIVSIILLVFHSLNLKAQNVGIGTSTPVEKLHVQGNILLDTAKLNAILLAPNAGTGKILTSDGMGNASWENMITPPQTNSNGNVGYGVWGDCATNGNIGEYNPVWDNSGAAEDHLGISTSISGDFAIAGAYEDDESVFNEGSATIFHFNGSAWEMMQKITDAEGAPGDNFGLSVSISGNYAIVGAYSDDDIYMDQGSASIYQYNGTSWELMQKLIDPEGEQSDQFGRSVSIAGNYAIVGSFTDDNIFIDQGSASIYQYNGSSWELMTKITDTDGDNYDYFGASVSLSDNYVIIGAYGDNYLLNSQGSASIYIFNGSTWDLMSKIADPNGYENDYFGWSVSISGTYCIIGAKYRNIGPFDNQGAALIYQYDGSNWIFRDRLNDDHGTANDNFGNSVCISGNYAIVGAPYHKVGLNTSQGSVTIFQKVGLGWQRLQYVQDPAGRFEDFMGYALALDGINNRFLIGAHGYAGNSGKIIFGKIN